ncbi:Rha family transcriptional regulator [uncultured Desulfovibrio sp.]|uniref:Rha family transcriptional regulator n=1 Tax=uncultured Desulfovibrio sp. TaxID=167968 RepID=UPI002601E885|nr:Rha family transcriptional regulator [uncultured Desulfovibrio sp.]
MAENSLSQAVSFINDNSTMEVGLTAEGQPAVRSDIVAYHFKRSHKNVLRDIAKLRSKCPESFHRLNFEPMFIETQIGNGATRQDRAYLLTRDGFSLLVMGFTGAEAVRWKLRYIEAFNSLEAAALAQRAELAREAGYRQGVDDGRAAALPDVKAAEAKGRAEGVALGMALRPVRREQLLKVRRYLSMGLTMREIGLLLGLRKSAAYGLIRQARELGLLDNDLPARPVQGNLLEVEA